MTSEAEPHARWSGRSLARHHSLQKKATVRLTGRVVPLPVKLSKLRIVWLSVEGMSGLLLMTSDLVPLLKTMKPRRGGVGTVFGLAVVTVRLR